MSLPKQVRQQIEDANRIQAELKAAQDAPAPADPTPPEAQPQEPAASVPAAEPATDTPTPAPQPAAPTVDMKAVLELQHQYRTLQGIHKSLRTQNGELQSQVQTLQAQVNALTQEVERARTTPNVPSFVPLTDAEVAEFGPDLISAIERKAQEVAAPLQEELRNAKAQINALQSKDVQLEQSLNGVAQTMQGTEEDRFTARLLALVPEFDVLNTDRNFLSWLSQVDPLDAKKRTLQERLNEATDALDADTVASYFSAFKQLRATSAPTPTPNIAAQAQPASRSAPDLPNKPAGPVWTQERIGQFYADVSKGKYTPQDKQRIEREIFKAQSENRIAVAA